MCCVLKSPRTFILVRSLTWSIRKPSISSKKQYLQTYYILHRPKYCSSQNLCCTICFRDLKCMLSLDILECFLSKATSPTLIFYHAVEHHYREKFSKSDTFCRNHASVIKTNGEDCFYNTPSIWSILFLKLSEFNMNIAIAFFCAFFMSV